MNLSVYGENLLSLLPICDNMLLGTVCMVPFSKYEYIRILLI